MGPLGIYHVTLVGTRMEVTQVCGQDEVEKRPCSGTQPKTIKGVVIQEDQDGDLGLVTTKLIYVRGPTLKRSPHLKPTTTILGILLQGS